MLNTEEDGGADQTGLAGGKHNFAQAQNPASTSTTVGGGRMGGGLVPALEPEQVDALGRCHLMGGV